MLFSLRAHLLAAGTFTARGRTWVGDGTAVAQPLQIYLRWQHRLVEGCPYW